MHPHEQQHDYEGHDSADGLGDELLLAPGNLVVRILALPLRIQPVLRSAKVGKTRAGGRGVAREQRQRDAGIFRNMPMVRNITVMAKPGNQPECMADIPTRTVDMSAEKVA